MQDEPIPMLARAADASGAFSLPQTTRTGRRRPEAEDSEVAEAAPIQPDAEIDDVQAATKRTIVPFLEDESGERSRLGKMIEVLLSYFDAVKLSAPAASALAQVKTNGFITKWMLGGMESPADLNMSDIHELQEALVVLLREIDAEIGSMNASQDRREQLARGKQLCQDLNNRLTANFAEQHVTTYPVNLFPKE